MIVMDPAFELMKEKVIFNTRFNPNHDKEGKFAPKGAAGGSSGGSGSSSKWSSAVDDMQAEWSGMKDNKKALYLVKNGFLSKEDGLKHMKAGTIDQKGKEYFEILKENGDYTPTKSTRNNDADRSQNLVDEGKATDITEARKMLIKQDTGFNDLEAIQTDAELQKFFSGNGRSADTAVLDRYIKKAPAYDGEIHRGLHFESAAELDAFMNGGNAGDRLAMCGNASWTSDEKTAQHYAHRTDQTYSSAIVTCLKNKSSVPVADLSSYGHSEDEVISFSKAQWTILHSEVATLPSGQKKAHIYVIESDRDDT